MEEEEKEAGKRGGCKERDIGREWRREERRGWIGMEKRAGVKGERENNNKGEIGSMDVKERKKSRRRRKGGRG